MAQGFSFADALQPPPPEKREQPTGGFSFTDAVKPAGLSFAEAGQSLDEAMRRGEFAPAEEFATGVKRAATVDLPSLWENAKVLKDAGAAATVAQRMSLFDRIDAGEISSMDQLRGLDLTTSQARSYLATNPEMRAKMRERLTKELGSRKDLVNASLETLKAYQEAGGKLAPRVDKFTSIENPTDFTNWLSSNVGAGAVNLAPIILAAATTGPAGLFLTGAGMGTAESVGNRLEALQKQLAEAPEDKRAQMVMDRLKETGGVDLAVGITSGVLDSLLGPAAAAAKFAARDVLRQSRTQAAKTALKETPKQMAEEFVTGGAQSLTQTAGKVAVGEQKEFLTKETFVNALNDAAAEAAGAPAGTAFNAARAALAAGKSPQEARNIAQRTGERRRTVLETLSEDEDVAGFDTTAGGAGAGMAGAPGPAAGAARVEGAEPSGVAPVTPATGDLAGGEAGAPAALGPTLSSDFRRQYNDLRSEMLELMNITSPTQADTNRMKLVQRDLTKLVEDNADTITQVTGDPQLAQRFGPNGKFPPRLTNPAFDGNKLLQDVELAQEEAGQRQARAQQGDMFGKRGAIDMVNRALLLAGQDPVKAVAIMQGAVQRIRERMPTISTDSDWGRRMAPTVNMTGAQGFNDPAKVAELYLAKIEKETADFAAAQPDRKSRAMAGDMFTTSPQQYVEIYSAEAARLTSALKQAQQELQTLQGLANRPSAEKIAEQKAAVDSYAGKLRAVQSALEKAQADVAAGVTATKVTPPAPPAPPPVPPEQQELFPAEPAAPVDLKLADRLVALMEQRSERRKAEAEEFGAEVPGEEAPALTAEQQQLEAEQEQRRLEAKEIVLAPEVSTERVLETPAGRLIKRFFDAIKPANQSQSEVSKHQASKNSAANTLLEYDIAKPGQQDLPGLQRALDYLAKKVGGIEKLNTLTTALEDASPAEQANLLRKAGLPDLTSRRGIDAFRDTVQREVETLTAKGKGVELPTKSVPSKITGTPVPYTEDLLTGSSRSVAPGPLGDVPRRPYMEQEARQFAISDTKIRAAARVLRQLVDSRLPMSKAAAAAAAYLNNPNPLRKTFGGALNAVAFDLAAYQVDPDGYGAGAVFPGEGGKYAQLFQEWIKTNLDKNTSELLDELVAMHLETLQANTKHAAAISAYRAAQTRYAEKRREQAEKATGVKLPKAPKKIRERVGETEASEQEAEPEIPEVPAKNLPTRQLIYEVHPDIKAALERGETREVLEVISKSGNNPYYALLADRLLAANITAKTTFIDQDDVQSLNQPNNDVLDNYIRTLGDMVTEAYPLDQQATLITMLQSGRLRDMIAAMTEMRATLPSTKATQGQIDAFDNIVAFFNKEYTWAAKYDPNTDTMVFRRNSGLTNATFLHEVLHAATSAYLDNPESLTGIQKQGYDQLMELYNYAKGALSTSGFAVEHIYGLNDLHEFVSEALTNPEFQAQLRVLRYKASPFSLSNWFTDAIRKLFNIKKGYESNVLNEVIFASDAMLLGTNAGKERLMGTTGAKAAPGPRVPKIPKGRPNMPGVNRAMFNALLKPKNWNQIRPLWPTFYANLKADVRPAYLGALTLDQLADLVNKRLPQLDNFIRVTNDFLSRKNSILSEAAETSKRWEQLQARDPDMSRDLGAVMHAATIREFDPDPLVPSTPAERAKNADVLNMWKALSPEAKAIYREVRSFYERRYSEYRRTLNRRLSGMATYGVSTTTINDIRAEFDKAKRKGPYFPLMRRGRFAYQIGSGQNREYYMFESLGEMEMHMEQRVAADPYLRSTVQPFYDYKEAMDAHARESNFLRTTFEAIDSANFTGSAADQDARKQELKDNVYQTWLANQPESSFRNRFVHRSSVEGFSQDALRNFATSSFHMAYQLSRFEYSPEMFSQMQAAKQQLKARIDPANPADPVVIRENTELSDYVKESERRLDLMLNPTDVGTIPSTLSNIGFIWYLSSFGSAAANILGGMIIGLPTLVSQHIRANPNMSYSRATLAALGQMKSAFGQIMMTGFDYETGPRIRDFALKSPSLQRSKTLSRVDQAAYDRFVADGVIDITGTYDMSGLAATPTEYYSGTRNKTMQVLTYLFHNAERFNREIIAMSAFRLAMEKRAGMANRRQAFAESIQEAKNTTNTSMFNYSSTNKPRYFQHPIARVVLQFKQFPQQMTFFLARSLWKSFAGADPAVRREARARFVGTMGMTAIFSGATGLWGFSTVASIVNAVAALFGGDDEEPFDFELEFKNWVVETFGKNFGTAISSGAFNAAGVDLGSRVKLDDMWFRDGRKNQDEVESLKTFLVDLLGPTVGLTVNVAEAVKLWNEGHPNRALEAIAPAFIKNPMIAYRYSNEGVNTLKGDPLMEDMGPFLLMMQSLGIRSAELADRQYYNITKKGQEVEILQRRTNLLNGFAISFMSNDPEGFDKALDKIQEFNEKYPSVRIPMSSLTRSIKERLEKSSQTEHGLFLDPRLREQLLNETYMDE
jgi:hypothetical protein